METAKNPLDVLAQRTDHILQRSFAGKAPSDEKVRQLCEKFELDADATAKLTAVMAQREMVLGCDIEKDLRDLDPHLTASEKPSALVCLKLKHLSSGAPIGPCMYALHGLLGCK